MPTSGFAWLYQIARSIRPGPGSPSKPKATSVVGCGSIFRSDKLIGGMWSKLPRPFSSRWTSNIGRRRLRSRSRERLPPEVARWDLRFLVGRPNEQALAICYRAGYQRIGNTHGWVKVIDADSELPNFSTISYADEIVSIGGRAV